VGGGGKVAAPWRSKDVSVKVGGVLLREGIMAVFVGPEVEPFARGEGLMRTTKNSGRKKMPEEKEEKQRREKKK